MTHSWEGAKEVNAPSGRILGVVSGPWRNRQPGAFIEKKINLFNELTFNYLK